MELRNMGTPKDQREERRYSVPQGHAPIPLAASEDLHAWSIYRQNLNSDFTDSALGSSDKSPLPYGNFQLRDTTVQSILNHPRYGPKSPLGSNMYAYLKFGLPRVFPPNGSGGSQRSHRPGPGPGTRGRINRGFRDSSGPGAGSSGYDSSDNETTRDKVPPNLRKYNSELDFRAIGGVSSRPNSRVYGNVPAHALKQVNSRASIAGTHVNHQSKYHNSRSHSEADLLSGTEMGYDYESRIYNNPRGRSSEQFMTSRKQSAAGMVYPNIQVYQLDVAPDIQKVQIQAQAGELFAIMATHQKEGTSLIEALAGLKQRISGEILVNGQQVSKRTLQRLCGYVPSPDNASLDPRMSVQSTLSFHATLRSSSDKSDLKERIDILVEDLGLSAVRSANISRLTHSEKQRLNVACQLLSQCSILLLDQTTSSMDIFDTFFLVEYLRQWCSTGRIVIMSLQPPTFEILSMCSGVLLLSGGRTVFSGSRSDLPKHLGSLGYPCPPFKNPADYYLDLVTLDNLSAAAMLESSQRIDTLANAWEHINSEPPLAAPMSNLPDYVRRASVFEQISAVSKRFISYKQPGSLLVWISKLIIAAVLSLMVGSIFWDIPGTDPLLNLNDRLGYHHCMLALTVFPLLLMFIQDIQEDRKYAEKDLRLELYGRTIYILVQSCLSVLPSLCIWLAYLLPAHSMSGNGMELHNMGYMLLYLTAIQTLALFSAHFCTTKISASAFFSLIFIILTSVGGYVVHVTNVPKYMKYLEFVSPYKWLLPILTENEFKSETIASTASQQLCKHKQVQRQEIIVQSVCPTPNGTEKLADFHLLASQHILDPKNIYESTLYGLVIACITFFLLSFFVFLINTKRFSSKKK